MAWCAGAAGCARPRGRRPYVDAIAEDLTAHRGTSIVLAGEAQPPAVHALAHAINQALGNIGSTITYVPPPEIVPTEQHAALRELVSDMNAGRVQMLVVIGESNPVQTAPADLNFADAMSKVQTRFHSGLFLDETATLCHWHVPAAHFLEAWSDARTVDGTVTHRAAADSADVQRQVGARSRADAARSSGAARLRHRPRATGWAAAGAGATGARVHRCDGCGRCTGAHCAPPPAPPAPVPQRGSAAAPSPAAPPPPPPPTPEQRPRRHSRRNWRRWLHDGFIPGTRRFTLPPHSRIAPAGTFAAPAHLPAPVTPFRHSRSTSAAIPTIYDGRFANNGWLQELPKPVTKLTWDNAALIAPATAERLDVATGDIIQVTHEGRQLRIPVFITPGHAQEP